MKILHLGGNDKFLPPFIDFVEEHFNPTEHEFLLTSGMGGEVNKKNVIIFQRTLWRRLQFYLLTLKKIQGANKIILHGLFDPYLIILLYFNPWVLKKCYWCIWGGDLYDHQLGTKNWQWQLKEFLRNRVIPRLGHFITHIRGDYELAQQWYGAKGQWHDCFMYPSNVYRDLSVKSTPHEGINILLGNSATPSNNHLDALEKLRPFANENICIYCPLSYGNASYAKKITSAGKAIFGGKFIPLREFMPLEKYLQLLADIDIAVFNHNRQQGIGNIITLLGMGKKVFIQKSITTWKTLEDLEIYIFNAKTINTKPLKLDEIKNNKEKINLYFSSQILIQNLKSIFGEA